MDTYTATEMAYNHGYDQGYAQGKKDTVKWIRVEDRLPEETGVYLVHDVLHGMRVFYFGKGAALSGWIGITHWMPLPEPPETCDGQDHH